MGHFASHCLPQQEDCLFAELQTYDNFLFCEFPVDLSGNDIKEHHHEECWKHTSWTVRREMIRLLWSGIHQRPLGVMSCGNLGEYFLEFCELLFLFAEVWLVVCWCQILEDYSTSKPLPFHTRPVWGWVGTPFWGGEHPSLNFHLCKWASKKCPEEFS